MECTSCGRYAAPDRETGYDADDLCPTCRDAEVNICLYCNEAPEIPAEAPYCSTECAAKAANESEGDDATD